MAMRTPLGRVRGLGSAKGGTEEFWRERVTSVALVPLSVAFVIVVVGLAGAPYEVARDILGRPFIAILMLLFVTVGVLHMKLGMQVIIEDYVHAEGSKLVALLANTFFSVVVGAAAVWAIAKLSFGG